MVAAPAQTAAADGMAGITMAGSMQAETGAQTLPSDDSAASAAVIGQPDSGSSSDHHRSLPADRLIDGALSHDSMAFNGMLPDVAHPVSTAGSPTVSSATQDAVEAAQRGDASDPLPPELPGADVAPKAMPGHGPREPLRHYWGQVGLRSAAATYRRIVEYCKHAWPICR